MAQNPKIVKSKKSTASMRNSAGLRTREGMENMCCKNCGDMYGKPTEQNKSCMYNAYDAKGKNWINAEKYHEAVVNPQSNLTKKQRQALASPAAKAKPPSQVSVKKAPFPIPDKKGVRREEVELDEAKLNIKKIHKAVDDGKSMDVIVGMFADKRTTNTDEIRKIVKDYMFKKRMKEETELEARVTSTAFRKKTARVNPMTQKDIERMVKDRKYKGNTSALMKDVKKKYPDEYESDIVQDMLQKHAETNEKLDEKYDLYHKSFSDAMQHAYDYAKRKMGITVDPKEIDNKVATGPKKPSEGKTNTYRLKGKGGNLQIQVYNKGGSKPFELNMYKEENEMKKSLKDTILEMRKEGFASDAQRKAAFASGYKEKDKKDKKEGVEEVDFFKGRTKDMTTEDKEAYEKFFNSALKKFGVKSPADFKSDEEKKKFFNYVDKNYKGENEKSEEVKESVGRYLETKRGSLRDAVLQMWGEKHTPDHKEDEKNEKKTLTKEKKDGIKKMTDTGKEVTPVEVSVKMPKIKETKNKV